MDNAIISNQFKEIEKKVIRLIEVCKKHEAANFELNNKIKSLEEELLGKIEAEKSYAQERALIRSKIDSLLVRLEEIFEVQNAMTIMVQVLEDSEWNVKSGKRKGRFNIHWINL